MASTVSATGPVAVAPRRRGGIPIAIKAGIILSTFLIPLSFTCLHQLAHHNTYVPLLRHLRDHGPPYLPMSTPEIYTFNSSDPAHPSYPKSGDRIVNVFTGSKMVDYWLRVLNCFFAPVFRDEEAMALGISLAGLFGVVVALLWVEGERKWTGWKKIFAVPAAWGLAMQGAGFGFITPIYSLLYLLATGAKPSAASSLPHTSSARIRALPFSIILGYVVPTLAMWVSYRVASTTVHQYTVAAWQIFPVYIAIFQFILSRVLSAEASPKEQLKSTHTNLETLYQFLVYFSRISHLSTLAYALTSFYRFSPTSLRIPINPSRLLIPAQPFSLASSPIAPVASFADGTLQFLQYDYICGLAAMAVLMWASKSKALKAVKERGRGIARGEVALDRVVTAILEGPGAVLAKMAWEREAAVWDLVGEGKTN